MRSHIVMTNMPQAYNKFFRQATQSYICWCCTVTNCWCGRVSDFFTHHHWTHTTSKDTRTVAGMSFCRISRISLFFWGVVNCMENSNNIPSVWFSWRERNGQLKYCTLGKWQSRSEEKIRLVLGPDLSWPSYTFSRSSKYSRLCQSASLSSINFLKPVVNSRQSAEVKIVHYFIPK